jgi:hypothetical protein
MPMMASISGLPIRVKRVGHQQTYFDWDLRFRTIQVIFISLRGGCIHTYFMTLPCRTVQLLLFAMCMQKIRISKRYLTMVYVLSACSHLVAFDNRRHSRGCVS